MWLPAIQFRIPGCGLTPFNVDSLTFMWWRIYRTRTQEMIDAEKKASSSSGRK